MKMITDGSENMIYYTILWSCLRNPFLNLLSLPVTVQPPALLWHPSIENRFARGRMSTDGMHSYGLCSERTDLAEL